MGTILEPFLYVIELLLSIYFKIVIVEVVLHWLLHFKILDVTNKYAKKTMEFLENVTHPVYAKMSELFEKATKKPSQFSGVDISPFVLLVVLAFLIRLIYRLRDAIL